MIELLDSHHEQGRLYRVDMRLRPEGASGELCLSFQQTVDYYYSVGRQWERQAMIKARPIAGSIALGERLLGELRPWVYPVSSSWESVEDTRMMRARIEERADDANLKAGAGGIRDIEFLVQFYQLGFAGRQPELRSRATLPTLRALRQCGLLGRTDAKDLEENYIWLREAEHRLQMHDARQLHAIPEDHEERLLLARACGFRGPKAVAAFLAEAAARREQVRSIANKHYLAIDPMQEAIYALLASRDGIENLDDGLRQQLIGDIEFNQPDVAIQRVRALAREPFFILSQARTERRLARLFPRIAELLQDAPEPDHALRDFVRIVEAVGGRSVFYQLLLDDHDLLRQLLALCGWSDFLVEQLTGVPGLPDEVLARIGKRDSLSAAARYRSEAQHLTVGLSDIATPLAIMKARELALVALEDLDGLSSTTVSFRLTHLAQAILAAIVDAHFDELAEKHGAPLRKDGAAARFSVLGAGKFGSGEMTYASDMDVIFVGEVHSTCPGSGRSGEWFFNRLAQRISQTCADPRLFRSTRCCGRGAIKGRWSQV